MRLEPVVEEGRLHLGDGGALDAEVRLAPVVLVLRVPEPFVADADAAGEADAAVDDEQSCGACGG